MIEHCVSGLLWTTHVYVYLRDIQLVYLRSNLLIRGCSACLEQQMVSTSSSRWGYWELCVSYFYLTVYILLNISFHLNSYYFYLLFIIGLIRLWTIRSGECENTFDMHSDRVWSIAVDKEDNGGRYLYVYVYINMHLHIYIYV